MHSIEESFQLGTLDYYWIIRSNKNRNRNLTEIADYPFKYLNIYRNIIEKDISLNTVTSLCTCSVLSKNVDINDKEVFFLSQLFNQIIKSNRKLYKCYDCGTNARAIFMKLVKRNRGNLYLSPTEQTQMKNYAPQQHNRLSELQNCYQKILNVTNSTVFICSIGIHKLGHVWIFEKKFNLNPDSDSDYRIHHYQSALNSHMALDFLVKMNYGEFPNKSINISLFFSKLRNIINHTNKWTPSIYRDFMDLFCFKPLNPIINPKPSFCWTFITY